MKAIETTGRFDKEGKLHLEIPLSLRNQKVKLIILIPEEEDITDEEWLSALGENEAFSFLQDPEEDIYSLEDGKPIKENAV